MESEEKLASQMREAIAYLSSVELMETPLQLGQGVSQLNPKKFFTKQVPIIRGMWKNVQQRERYIYHFMIFYKAVKAHYDGKENKEQEPSGRTPVEKKPRAKRAK